MTFHHGDYHCIRHQGLFVSDAYVYFMLADRTRSSEGRSVQTLVAAIINMPQSVLPDLDNSRRLKSFNCSSMDHNSYLLEYDDRFQDPSALWYYHGHA
jgi:hypothetical protein